MKVIIAGSRTFDDYELLKLRCDFYLTNLSESEIVSGCAKGADLLGEDYAAERGLPIKRFPADWDKYKKAAGPIRNKQMGEYADCAIIFWDGKSKGSKNMIEVMKELNKPYKVVSYA